MGGGLVDTALAQREPSADSLVAYWLKRGALANWQPHELFAGCPNLRTWQTRGIELLLKAKLTPERERDLAGAWAPVLRTCHDQRVENWYFERLEAAAGRGDPEGITLKYWMALQDADSPAIREFLRGMMLSPSRPLVYRNTAGSAFFVRLGPADRLREYLSAFETGRLPDEVAWGQTDVVGKQDPDRLAHEVGTRVRANPELADQAAFSQLVQSVGRKMTPTGRSELKNAIKAGLARPGLSARARAELERSEQILTHTAD